MRVSLEMHEPVDKEVGEVRTSLHVKRTGVCRDLGEAQYNLAGVF